MSASRTQPTRSTAAPIEGQVEQKEGQRPAEDRVDHRRRRGRARAGGCHVGDRRSLVGPEQDGLPLAAEHEPDDERDERGGERQEEPGATSRDAGGRVVEPREQLTRDAVERGLLAVGTCGLRRPVRAHRARSDRPLPDDPGRDRDRRDEQNEGDEAHWGPEEQPRERADVPDLQLADALEPEAVDEQIIEREHEERDDRHRDDADRDAEPDRVATPRPRRELRRTPVRHLTSLSSSGAHGRPTALCSMDEKPSKRTEPEEGAIAAPYPRSRPGPAGLRFRSSCRLHALSAKRPQGARRGPGGSSRGEPGWQPLCSARLRSLMEQGGTGCPDTQIDVLGHEFEIAVGREHDEFVGKTESGEERVGRPDLDTVASTGVADLGCANVVGPVGDEQGKRREAIDDGSRAMGP